METITTDTFHLEMRGDWKGTPTGDPEQFSLASESQDTALTLSTFVFPESADLALMAERLLDVRLGAEQSAAEQFQRHMEIAEPQVSPSDRGLYAQYFGRDTTGRHFRYFAILVPGKIMSIYAESGTADFEQLDEALQEVFEGLQF
jgi:hypothetical protein